MSTQLKKLPGDYRERGDELVAILLIQAVAVKLQKFKRAPSIEGAYELGKSIQRLENVETTYEQAVEFYKNSSQYRKGYKRIGKFLNAVTTFYNKYVYI